MLAQFLIGVFLPFGNIEVLTGMTALVAAVVLPLKLLAIFVMAGVIENSMARGRFMLTSRVTWIGFGFAVLAFVFYLTGL